MCELRKSKGLTPEDARKQLQDTVVLGTMMMAQNDVDGLVSGAVHTTANTIRPALQLIKTAPGASLVSSVFFMLLPNQVLVFGDCAVNPNPTAQQLADIAIQSADSAKAFGIDPKVAMISYSTVNSGSGPDVDTVIEATKLARENAPTSPSTARCNMMRQPCRAWANQSSRQPGGRTGNRFGLPDLNTGNCTYKAVQRSANVLSVGPLLQGLRKPINDLSRGALVEDIVFTIALTAVQAKQMEALTNGFPGLNPMPSEDRLPFSDGIFISPAHLFVKIAAILQKKRRKPCKPPLSITVWATCIPY